MFEHTVDLRAPSLAATHAIAAALAGLARVGDVIVLAGEMGSGKTAFAQGFGRALGVAEPITSPTFTLVHSYDVTDRRCTLHHADLYRLDRTVEVADLALLELAEDRGIVLVEWGDVADQLLGDHLTVLLERDDEPVDEPASDVDADDADSSAEATGIDFGLDEGRTVELSTSGTGWAARWPSLLDALEAYRC